MKSHAYKQHSVVIENARAERLRDEQKPKGFKRSPLKKMGKDKARETAKYWPLRRRFLEDAPFCEVPSGLHDCTLRATTIHHSKGQHWKIMNDTQWWIAACLNGHVWIEDNKREARNRGLILYK